MIGWLKGRLLERHAPEILVDVNGIGYEVQVPMTTFYKLPENGLVELYIHFVVREDAQLLYGFASKSERSLFRSLIKVNGVGPRIALAILSGIEPQRFVDSVQNNDMDALVKIPGIGKKTAERLLIEMRDRLKEWYLDGDATLAGIKNTARPSSANLLVMEAESALIALGYKPAEATKMIAAVNSAEMITPEQLIKAALKRMV